MKSKATQATMKDIDLHYNAGKNTWRKLLEALDQTEIMSKIECINGKTNDLDIANEFAKFNESLCAPINNPIKPKEDLFMFTGDEITESEILKAVKKLKSKKSSPTNMKNELIKFAKDAAVPYLHIIFNDFYKNGTTPLSWRQGLITSLFKKGKRDDPSNYRPITLLPILGKLYASIINAKLVNHVESNNLIHTSQNGFRLVEERNTDDHIISLTELYDYHKCHKSPLFVGFIDFSKAFDGVPRQALLATLQKTGINKRLYEAIKSMYRKTTAKCRVNGVISRSFEIHKGVAQGCPLSPTLFAIYINSLLERVHDTGLGVDLHDGQEPISALAYADDIVLVAESQENLQSLINIAHEWCEKWGMKANVAKCGIQAVGVNKNIMDQIQIRWGDAFFPLTPQYKYLGLTFEPDMKWTKHIQKIYGSALGKLQKLNFSLRNSNLGLSLKRHLYEENIRSQMEYGNLAWGRSKNAVKLDKIQKRALLTIADLQDAWLPALEGEFGLHNLDTRRKYDSAKYMHKIFSMDKSRIPKRIFLRKWTKNVSKSFMSHTKLVRRRWKLRSPSEINDATKKDIDENDPNIKTSLRNAWKSHVKSGMNLRQTIDNNKNRSENNKFYKHLIPSTSKIKSYLHCYNKGNRLKLAATTCSLIQHKCPLCGQADVNLSRHVLLRCGSTYKDRVSALKSLGLNWKRNYNANIFMDTIYNADPTNETVSDYLETAANSFNSALNKLDLQSKSSEELIGKIIDLRQDGSWYRSRVVKFNKYNGLVTINSKGLDNWPFDYDTISIEELKSDELQAIKIRDNNSLSFTKLGANTGKTIYIKGIPSKLVKHIGRYRYETTRGKINLKTLLARGCLNDCPFNGTVAKRYASADKRESNANRYGVT